MKPTRPAGSANQCPPGLLASRLHAFVMAVVWALIQRHHPGAISEGGDAAEPGAIVAAGRRCRR